jgi:hypothetical protein
MADPGRMMPEERKQAHALLTRALSDPNWQTASQALDDLTRKLLVMHRLLEAEERLAKKPSAEPTSWPRPSRVKVGDRSGVRAVSRWGPQAGGAARALVPATLRAVTPAGRSALLAGATHGVRTPSVDYHGPGASARLSVTSTGRRHASAR